MTIPEKLIYPRTGDKQTVYLKYCITDPAIPNGGYYFNLRFKLDKDNKIITVFTKTEFGEEPYSLCKTFVVEGYY